MADVFSIITTLQALEKAYIKDLVEPAEYVTMTDRNNYGTKPFRYTRNCEKLLAKYKAAFRQIESEFLRIEDFIRKYRVKFLFLLFSTLLTFTFSLSCFV